VFGKDQVFLDKQDLRGGSSWRDEIMAALGTRPVVLALITPDYFGAVEGDSRRIDRADDPVGEELAAAFEANAQIIPLLSEGVKMPAAPSLPARPQVIAGRWVAVAVVAFLIAVGLEAVLIADKSSGADDYFGAAAVGLMPFAAALYAARTLKGCARWMRYTAVAMVILTGW